MPCTVDMHSLISSVTPVATCNTAVILRQISSGTARMVAPPCVITLSCVTPAPPATCHVNQARSEPLNCAKQTPLRTVQPYNRTVDRCSVYSLYNKPSLFFCVVFASRDRLFVQSTVRSFDVTRSLRANAVRSQTRLHRRIS